VLDTGEAVWPGVFLLRLLRNLRLVRLRSVPRLKIESALRFAAANTSLSLRTLGLKAPPLSTLAHSPHVAPYKCQLPPTQPFGVAAARKARFPPV